MRRRHTQLHPLLFLYLLFLSLSPSLTPPPSLTSLAVSLSLSLSEPECQHQLCDGATLPPSGASRHHKLEGRRGSPCYVIHALFCSELCISPLPTVLFPQSDPYPTQAGLILHPMCVCIAREGIECVHSAVDLLLIVKPFY